MTKVTITSLFIREIWRRKKCKFSRMKGRLNGSSDKQASPGLQMQKNGGGTKRTDSTKPGKQI